MEVGARGYVAFSAERCFRQLGMQKRTVSSLSELLSRVVARCSYAIYLARNNKAWDEKRKLLTEADRCARELAQRDLRLPVQDPTTDEPHIPGDGFSHERA